MSSQSFANLGVSSVPKFIWNHDAQIRRCPRDWFLQYRAYLPWASAALADPVTRSLTLQNHETIANFAEDKLTDPTWNMVNKQFQEIHYLGRRLQFWEALILK